jgi:hypothetical protein
MRGLKCSCEDTCNMVSLVCTYYQGSSSHHSSHKSPRVMSLRRNIRPQEEAQSSLELLASCQCDPHCSSLHTSIYPGSLFDCCYLARKNEGVRVVL